MSHVAIIDLFITDLDSLAKACERLGLELVKGQKTFKSYQRGLKCEHAIRVKGNAQAYEIGVSKRTDGKAGYTLGWDSFLGGHGLAEKVQYKVERKGSYADTNMNKLKDWYAAEVARKTMARQGFRVTAKQQTGKVQVLCSK